MARKVGTEYGNELLPNPHWQGPGLAEHGIPLSKVNIINMLAKVKQKDQKKQ